MDKKDELQKALRDKHANEGYTVSNEIRITLLDTCFEILKDESKNGFSYELAMKWFNYQKDEQGILHLQLNIRGEMGFEEHMDVEAFEPYLKEYLKRTEYN